MGKIREMAGWTADDIDKKEQNSGEKSAKPASEGIRRTAEQTEWQRKEYLLFDLDGTLTDPKIGITTCVQYALKAFGIEEPDLDKLESFIGPPLQQSFMEFYNFSEEQAAQAVEKYRERFAEEGIFENEVYRGIPQMLKALKNRGIHLAVASSKPTVYVERILEHFRIRQYFEVVVGSELDGTRTRKQEVVLETLRKLFPAGSIPKNKIYMIGDRKFDVEGAKAFGIESVGVSFGYGSIQELMEAHADYIVRSVEELKRFLMRGFEDIRKDLTPFQKVWILLFHFVIFMAVRGLVKNLILVFLGSRGVEVLTPDQAALIGMVSNLAGGAAIFKGACKIIRRTIQDMYLTHLTYEPKKNYALLALSCAGLSLGSMMLISLSGLTGASETFAKVSAAQGSVSLGLAILCFVLVSPAAEELLFRGIFYGYLRKFMDIRTAVILSAILFGVFHGNMVQAVYATAMGYLIAYAYEYFGSFKIPILMHAGMNLLMLLLNVSGLEKTFFYSWPVCGVLLLAGSAALFFLARKKRVL